MLRKLVNFQVLSLKAFRGCSYFSNIVKNYISAKNVLDCSPEAWMNSVPGCKKE
jgi:hypothetical protein